MQCMGPYCALLPRRALQALENHPPPDGDDATWTTDQLAAHLTGHPPRGYAAIHIEPVVRGLPPSFGLGCGDKFPGSVLQVGVIFIIHGLFPLFFVRMFEHLMIIPRDVNRDDFSGIRIFDLLSYTSGDISKVGILVCLVVDVCGSNLLSNAAE